jgi:hypothetical protein
VRAIAVTLYANDGAGGVGASSSVTGKIADLGKLAWSLDEEYSKFSPGTLTVKVWDEDEAIWSWLDTQINTGVNQQFPPWIVLTVGGTVKFTGVLDVSAVSRDLKTRTIQFTAQDWSALLKDKVLDGPLWERAFPRDGAGSRGFAGPFSAAVFNVMSGWVPDNPENLVVQDPGATLDLQEGDTIRHGPTGTGFKIAGLFKYPSTLGGNGFIFNLPGFTGEGYASPWTFTRDASLDTLVDQHYYLAPEGIVPGEENPLDSSPIYVAKLDTTEQLTPGDVLVTSSGGEININDVDSERSEVISLEPITASAGLGQKLYLSADSRETLVYEEAGTLLARAAMPYAMDLTRFVAPTLSRPILAWLPLRIDGRDLNGARDVEPTLAALRIWGTADASWTGTPDAGWTVSSGAVRNVPWTAQLTSAPAVLLPDETPALAPNTGPRNRGFYEWKYVRAEYLDAGWGSIEPVYTPAQLPAVVLCHDYNQLRRLKMTNTTGNVLEQRWSGSAWSGGSTVAWPVAGWKWACAVPMPGVAATTGPVAPQGQAILAVCNNGVAWELQLAFAGATVRLALDSALVGAQLRVTPWGAFLLGPGGYGRITYAAGVLTLAWASVRGAGQAVLLPSTFAAIDNSAVWCFAQFNQLDKEGKQQTEIHLLQLSTTPDPTGEVSPILSSEMVSKGAPRLIMAVKDPSANRVVGMLGGRFFQVAAKLPSTIERVRAYGMTGAELIEHIAQAMCAVAAATPTGTIQIISRVAVAPVALTVDRVSVTQMKRSKYFFSVVRVSGENDTYADVLGAWKGGTGFELSNMPLIWTEGGCFALASAYAQFHGVPREEEAQKWFHEDADAAAPWESLLPWATLTINGGSNQILTGLEYDVISGEATAKLLEAL